MIEIITWNDVNVLPDDNMIVLIFSPISNDPIWLGYHEDDKWYAENGDTLSVSHWANLPNGPI